MYKDKRGLWRETLYIDGKRKVFSGKTKKDVALKMAYFDIKHKETITFQYVAEAWQEENWERLRFGSYRTYSPCLQRAIEKFGQMDLERIKPLMIKSWLQELGDRYAFKTVQNHKTVISQIFDYAIVNLGYDIPNPCDRVKLPSNLKKGTRKALSTDEVHAILSTTKDDFQLGFVILFTGARCGEALALKMSDVDFKKKIISIHSQVSHHGNQPTISPPKTVNSIRNVPLLPELEKRLKELKLKKDDYIVSGDAPLTKSALDKRWKKFCKEKSIDIDRHSIRHHYATVLYNAGIDAKSAQLLLGHAQISTTMDIYTHISDEKKAEDYIKLANYNFG